MLSGWGGRATAWLLREGGKHVLAGRNKATRPLAEGSGPGSCLSSL